MQGISSTDCNKQRIDAKNVKPRNADLVEHPFEIMIYVLEQAMKVRKIIYVLDKGETLLSKII